MNAVLLDTSCLIALANRRDHWHEAATAAYAGVIESGKPLVVTSLVLTELADSLSALDQRPLACALRERLLGSRGVEIIHVDPELDRRGWELYGSRGDKEWSHTDCVSFVVMQDQGITEALTADHHYQQAGFTCLIQL